MTSNHLRKQVRVLHFLLVKRNRYWEKLISHKVVVPSVRVRTILGRFASGGIFKERKNYDICLSKEQTIRQEYSFIGTFNKDMVDNTFIFKQFSTAKYINVSSSSWLEVLFVKENSVRVHMLIRPSGLVLL